MSKKNTEKKVVSPDDNSISRREAINKLGYAAFASSTMFILLNNPTKVYAQSPGTNPPPPDPFDPSAKSSNTKESPPADEWSNDSDPWK